MENQRMRLVFVLFLVLSANTAFGQLKTDFYKNTCPNVESLVRSAVRQKFQQTFVTAPATLRLFFHDCFVKGCDATMLLSSPNGKAAKDHPDNLSLAGDGFDTVVKAKAAVDRDPKCRNKVSCADILALATREVVAMTGGPFYQVELGRRDGIISTLASVQHQLPGEGFNLDQLNTMFVHIPSVSPTATVFQRGSTISAQKRVDPTLNGTIRVTAKKMCPLRVDPRIAINMDPTTPNTFDNAYFKNLQQGKETLVNFFASNNDAFIQAFAIAMIKLGRVGVLTGNRGEIRFDRTRPN
ncbi:unnamed protein product [Withania somnifera]